MITYYNYDKKGHYLTTYLEPLKANPKKLVLVLATSFSMTGTWTEAILDWVPCIYYPVYFWKNSNEVRVFIYLGSEVNTMAPAYVKKLGLQILKTNIEAQTIDGPALETYVMVIACFQI